MTAGTERVVAIDLGGTGMKGSLIDRAGRSGPVRRRPTPVAGGPEAVVEAVLSLAEELRDAEESETVTAGLAVPGLVDEERGFVRAAANLGWREVDLGSLAQRRLAMPVVVNHDVRAAALAEGLVGAARGVSDYVLLTLGTGIGAAIVIGGRAYTGANGLGGELGHVAVAPDGPMCGCGRRGCLEAIASASAVVRRYRELGGDDQAVSTAERVIDLAADGDPCAERVWEQAIDALAGAIADYVTLLDPELVVIGGGMACSGPRLFGPLQAALPTHLRFTEAPPLVPASLGDQAGRYGAAIAAWRTAGMRDAELTAWVTANAPA
ncbi:MAG: ROK family protein [Solirubrobacteraceae bacterium]